MDKPEQSSLNGRNQTLTTIPELLTELRSLDILSDGSSPALRLLRESTGPAGQEHEIRFESEPGIEITGKVFIPQLPGRKPAVLLVADTSTKNGIPSTDSLAKRIAKTGSVVLELQTRDSPGRR